MDQPATLDVEPVGEIASLATRAYAQLKAAISSMNIYAPGADLRMDERGLSDRLGISRTPLRDALTRLDQEGLVQIVPRRGIFIVRKTKAEILEMIVAWAALESMAARLACEVASDEELAGLHCLVDAYATEGVEQFMAEYSDANIRFHSRIIALSRCALLGQLTDGLFMHVRAIRERTIFENNRAHDSLSDHAGVVRALEARDADLAARLVREHTMKLHDHVREFVDID